MTRETAEVTNEIVCCRAETRHALKTHPPLDCWRRERIVRDGKEARKGRRTWIARYKVSIFLSRLKLNHYCCTVADAIPLLSWTW